MADKKISRLQYKFIKREVEEYKEREIIDQKQMESIMDIYEVSNEKNFIRVVLTIGAVLIGLGIMSFFASNWQQLSKISKFSVVISALAASIYAAYRLEDEYPRISLSMIYISALVYGSGIFLAGQIFNYGGDFGRAFLLWGVGIIPMAVFFSDRILFTFSHICIIIYLGGRFDYPYIAYPAIVLIPAYYYLNRYVEDSAIGTFFTNIVLVDFVIYFADRYNVEAVYTALFIFMIGAAMYFMKTGYNKKVFEVEGIIIMGISGIVLTYKNVWNDLSYLSQPGLVAVIFGILLVVLLLWFASKAHVSAIVFICIVILRYYFDTLYDFMPKSLFFTLGGVILIGFGYYIEKMRKRGEADARQ